jgi:hypothetical protein
LLISIYQQTQDYRGEKCKFSLLFKKLYYFSRHKNLIHGDIAC